MVFLLTEYLDMVLLPLVLLSALSVLVLLLEVLLEVLLDMVLLDMASVKLMLTLMLMLTLDMVMLAQLPHLLPSVTVSQSEPATRSLSAPPERLLRLCARKLLISRSSRIVLILSAPPAPSNLSSSLTPLLLLELTPGSDQKLLLQLTEPSLLELLLLLLSLLLLLLPLLLLEELSLPMVELLPPLLLDMLAPESDLLDMLDINCL